MPPILVTGAAGFIGYHCALRLLDRGDAVVGIDNLNDYYDVSLKEARLARLMSHSGFRFIRADIADEAAMTDVFEQAACDRVLHLAAQAGVRYSLSNPRAYTTSNLQGFSEILERCRSTHVKHLVYASSSSVYGANRKVPFSVRDRVDHPVSLYAATKKANELMAHSYSHLFRLPTTGLRFFTVYGPWGRPDMALFLFTRAILADEPITLFNYGEMRRDFTYVDDVVEAVVRVLDRPPAPRGADGDFDNDPSRSPAPYALYNIGNSNPVELRHLVSVLEQVIGKSARTELAEMQPGDVPATYADVEDLSRDVGFRPDTSIEEGVARFVSWYRSYYGASVPSA